MQLAAPEQTADCIIFFPFMYVEIDGVWDYLKLLWRISMDLAVLDYYAKLGVELPLIPPELKCMPAAAWAHAPLVLVVDDDPRIRACVCRSLKAAGFRVEQAANGYEALAALEHERPNGVVLDLSMPTMPGDEVLDRIRRVDSTVPVVMFSGYLDGDSRMRLTAHGATAFIDKTDMNGLVQEMSRVATTPPGGMAAST